MWQLFAVLAVVAVLFKVIEMLTVVAIVVGALWVVGQVVQGIVRLGDRRPVLTGGDVELVACCDYRDHEGETAVCGCVNHPRSRIHPFGGEPWPL